MKLSSSPAPKATPPAPTVEERIDAIITRLLEASDEYKRKLVESKDKHVDKLLKALKRPDVTSLELNEIYAAIGHPKLVVGRFVIRLWLEARISKLPQSYIDSLGNCVPGRCFATTQNILS